MLQPCLHGENWCENPPEYPNDFIRHAMNSSHALWSLMKQNSEPKQHRHHHRGSHRQPRLLQEASRPACDLIETFVRPRAARNKELEWRFIVNDLEEETEYQQVCYYVLKVFISFLGNFLLSTEKKQEIEDFITYLICMC